MNAERLPCIACLLNLVLIAEVVFRLQRGHTQRHTDTQSHMPLITLSTHRVRELQIPFFARMETYKLQELTPALSLSRPREKSDHVHCKLPVEWTP